MHAAFDCLLPPGVVGITLCVHGWVEGVCVYMDGIINLFIHPSG